MTQYAPLTKISEDEKLFLNEIEKFAREQIGPKVEHMDETETMDPDLVKQLFDMGLMGIEIPEQFGGSGSSFFTAILAVEALAKVDPSVSVLCDVQNTLVNNIFMRWGSDAQKAKYLPLLASSHVGSYCLTEPNSGSDAFAMTSRAFRRR
jgi:alkylation response protein AidB-like acyl-CoA dehydrogenase